MSSNNLMKMDSSWNPIRNLLFEPPLSDLSIAILPISSFQPRKEDIFNVFETPLNKIKVVILGQDPYQTPGYAIGRAFAVPEEQKIPASLRIIAKEIENEGLKSGFYDSDVPCWKTLQHWTEQGVFLLNTALTVETGNAGSHLNFWKNFTIETIKLISAENPCIWLLWGNFAKSYIPYIKNSFLVKGYDKNTIQNIPIVKDYNYVLQAPHPASEAYSGGKAGFYGCNHFTFTNIILKKQNKKIILF